jgi:hypothetical protein
MVSREDVGPAIVVAGVTVALGASTIMPGVGFWDTAELQTVAPILGTAHPTGFPTYLIFGWLASILLSPFGEPALRMNLFSLLSIAVAAAVTVDLVRALSGSRAVGMAVGLGFALSPLAWELSTRAETHTLHVALVVILLRLLVAWEDRRRAADTTEGEGASTDRWLVAAAVAFAVAAGNHSLTLLLAPPIALFVLAVEPGILRRPRFIATCTAALFGTLTLVYLYLPVRAGLIPAPLVYGRPETWEGFWSIVLAEQFRGSLVDPLGDLGGKVVDAAGRAAEQIGPLALALPIAVIATAVRRPRYALLSGTSVVITVLFSAAYVNADIERYDLGPLLFAWTWLGVLGGTLADRLARVVRSVVTLDRAAPVDPRAVLVGGLALLLLLPTVVDLPERQQRVDRSWDRTAARWLDAVDAAVEPDAVIVSWWSYSTPLWYAQHVEGRLSGVDIIDDRTRLDEELGSIVDVIDRHLGRRPVYVIRVEPAEWRLLEEEYVIEHIEMPMPDSLSRIVARREAGL